MSQLFTILNFVRLVYTNAKFSLVSKDCIRSRNFIIIGQTEILRVGMRFVQLDVSTINSGTETNLLSDVFSAFNVP